ncbi:MAG: hypothetical protein JXR10_05550 [Cyclobacteriaceae bacterium]
MKLKLLSVLVVLILSACGGTTKSTENTAEKEAIVLDSITTALDEIKTEVQSETDQTVEEIDEILKDI